MEHAEPDKFRPPSPLSLFSEARTALTWPKIILGAPALAKAPRGDGRPIVLAPGYLAGDLSMQPLASYLRWIGYDAATWGLGRNSGDVDPLVHEFGLRLEKRVDEKMGPVTLIGWSLGGVIAREAARLFSEEVREVITLGTPIVGGPKYTSVGKFFARRRGIDLDEFELEVHARNSVGLDQPLTSIYSKSDGVVDWRASVDTYNTHTQNIEVKSSHFRLGVDPNAWRIIAEILAGEVPSTD
jgi:pimeloyl-ACP methyl ester carboxylesterase